MIADTSFPDIVNSPLTLGGLLAIVMGLLVWLIRWFVDKHINKILDNNREDINNGRKEFLVALESLSTKFENELKEQRDFFREEQKEVKEVLSKMSDEVGRLGNAITKHEAVLANLASALNKTNET